MLGYGSLRRVTEDDWIDSQFSISANLNFECDLSLSQSVILLSGLDYDPLRQGILDVVGDWNSLISEMRSGGFC